MAIAWAGVATAAPDKAACIDADTTGQGFRLHGKLLAARKQLQICASPSCPAMVRDDCAQRLGEVTHAVPSVLLAASDKTGTLTDVTVTVDGVQLATTLGTDPVEVDPGEHWFVFSAKDHLAATRVVLVPEGGRSVPVSAVLALGAPAPPPAAPGVAPLRIAGIVTAAVGIVGLGLGAGFGIAGYSAWASVNSECFQASTCDLSKATPDRNRAIDFASASDAAFIAGGVLTTAGIVMFLLAPRARAERVARITPLMGPGLLGVTFEAPL
jgi:hypothetical protein